MQELEPKSGLGERGEDLTERMIPSVLDEPVRRGLPVGIRALHLETERLGVRPVRVGQAQLPGLDAFVLEDLGNGMDLGQIEETARADEMRRDAAPGHDVREPAENATRGVDDVEPLVEHVRKPVDVGHDEPGGNADIGCERPRRRDRLLAEVDAGDRGPETRPRERIEPEVALQVKERLPIDATDLLELVFGDPDGSFPVAKRLDVVELGIDVDLRPRVPELAVLAEGLVDHSRSLVNARSPGGPGFSRSVRLEQVEYRSHRLERG